MIELPVYNFGAFEPRPQIAREPLPVASLNLKRKGRKPRPYGPGYGCTSCRRPPRYRNNWIVDCICGAPPNPHAPVVLVRFVGDEA